MSGVVLRCPTCGTTQGHRGECDACLDGDVRYFCSNHSPGLWLDDAVCNECGAKFGDAPGRAPAPTPRARPTVTGPEWYRTESPPPLRADAAPPLARSRGPTPDPEDTAALPSLAELLLAHISEERERTRDDFGEVLRPAPVIAPPRWSFPVLGCLFRALVIVLVLIALAFGGLFLLLGGALS